VATAIGTGAAAQQSERSTAPLSVTSDKELSSRNIYHDDFTTEMLPLDGDYDGEREYVGRAVKHGCTNDIKDCWARTAIELRKFGNDEKSLQSELLKLNLVSRPGTSMAKKRASDNGNDKLKQRRKRKQREAFTFHNSHLKGTVLWNVLHSSNGDAGGGGGKS
jgi:hypothetical protein